MSNKVKTISRDKSKRKRKRMTKVEATKILGIIILILYKIDNRQYIYKVNSIYTDKYIKIEYSLGHFSPQLLIKHNRVKKNNRKRLKNSYFKI